MLQLMLAWYNVNIAHNFSNLYEVIGTEISEVIFQMSSA